MRSTEYRPSTALLAIGAFVVFLLVGAAALLIVLEKPASASEVRGEAAEPPAVASANEPAR